MNYIYTIKNFCFKFLDSRFKKDFLWEETKKKIVFKKLKHLLYYLIFCYCVLGYIIISLERTIASGEFSLFITSVFCAEYRKFINYRELFVFLVVYLFIWVIFYCVSFFKRKVHEAIYTFWGPVMMWSWLFLLYSTFELSFQLENILFDTVFLYMICFCIPYLFTSTLIHLETDPDDEEELEFMENFNDNIWLEKNKYIIDDLLNEKKEEDDFIRHLREGTKAEDFQGDLQNIPNAFAVDVKASIEYIIHLQKKRIEDEKEYGIQQLLSFRGRILRLYPDKSITQNYILNIKKVLSIFLAFFNTELDDGETIIEIEARYQRERVLRSPAAYRKNLLGLSDEEKLIELNSMFVKEEIYLDPWYSSKWYKHMNEEEAQWFKWWISDQVPFFVKIYVILKRFYFEYRIGVIKTKKTNKVLFFWDAFYSFFGIKWEKEKFIIKYENGYIGWVRGQPKFIHMHSRDFDAKLYNQPVKVLPSISRQFADVFINGFKYIKNFFMFFFYLLTSWGSWTYWLYVLKSTISIPKLFMTFFSYLVRKTTRFFKRKYAFFYINFLPFLKYVRSVIFYLLYTLFTDRFFGEKTSPAGPYNVYNPMEKLKKYYILSPFLFFKNQRAINKIYKSVRKSLRKSKKRKLFLVWSSYKKTK